MLHSIYQHKNIQKVSLDIVNDNPIHIKKYFNKKINNKTIPINNDSTDNYFNDNYSKENFDDIKNVYNNKKITNKTNIKK